MEDIKKENSEAKVSKSRSPSRSKSPARSPSRSRSRSKSRSRSRSRSISRSVSRSRSRSRSRSASPRRNRRRSPTPPPSTLFVEKLTRNVNKDHLNEIFGHFGKVRNVDLLWDMRANLSKGAAYIAYESHLDAQKAQLHMDGAQVDGNVVKVSMQQKRGRSPPRGGNFQRRRFSPPRNMGRPFRGGRGGGPPYRRSPPRGRSPPRRGGRMPMRPRSPPRRPPYGARRRSPIRRSRSRSPRRKRSYSSSRSRSPVKRRRNASRSRSYSSSSRSSSRSRSRSR